VLIVARCGQALGGAFALIACLKLMVAATGDVRRIAKLGSLIMDAPLSNRLPKGTVIEKVAPPKKDRKPPTITIAGLPHDRVFTKGRKVRVTVRCRDGKGVGVARCPKRVRLSTSSVGRHVVTVEAWDRNGNLATKRIHYRVRRAPVAST
jgi:hypothetical protein